MKHRDREKWIQRVKDNYRNLRVALTVLKQDFPEIEVDCLLWEVGDGWEGKLEIAEVLWKQRSTIK